MTARLTSADVAVVGAGPTGCVMARRLAEAGADVLLLEAGAHAASPRAGLLDVGPESLVVTRHPARLGDAQLDLPRGHTLGGSGAVNGGYCVAARPADLATWGPGWQRRYEAGLARAAERLRPTLVPMSPVAARVAAAFPGRASAVPQARRGARRVTAFDAWDPPGAGARVRTGARVARLHWAGGEVGGRCDGVVLEPARPEPARPEEGSARIARESGAPNPLVDEARGDDEVITARHVILCAGTIGTTSILRNSGLGSRRGTRSAIGCRNIRRSCSTCRWDSLQARTSELATPRSCPHCSRTSYGSSSRTVPARRARPRRWSCGRTRCRCTR
ncbi:mycofactocin system GMC family oxidoreductase MftG [Dietzia aerolata]|uniref:mycofactocin system GMC family oxidoreductase MftG n=1 Tax=Dietzia aerolata TaxID=595984 RepID=UPI003638393C